MCLQLPRATPGNKRRLQARRSVHCAPSWAVPWEAAQAGHVARGLTAAARGLRQAVGLEEKADCRAGTLSGGSKRKLQVGIALLADSRVVLLDEPSSGAALRRAARLQRAGALASGPWVRSSSCPQRCSDAAHQA